MAGDRDIVRLVTLPVRIAQIVFAIIVLGLAAYVASNFNDYGRYFSISSPSEINFLIFTAVWTILASIYLIVVPMRFEGSVVHHKFAVLGVEAVTAIFWFAGFIAVAVWIDQTFPRGYRVSSFRLYSTSVAAVVFGAFEWLLFTATTAFAALHVSRAGRTTKTANPNINVQEGV